MSTKHFPKKSYHNSHKKSSRSRKQKTSEKKLGRSPSWGVKSPGDSKQMRSVVPFQRGAGFKYNLTKLHEFLKRRDCCHVERKHSLSPSHSLMTHDTRTFEPMSDDAIAMSTSLMNPLTVYRFFLGGYTTLVTAGGIINSFIASDPSASGWNSPEWASISSLFSEFRLVSFSVEITSTHIGGTSVFPLGICSNLGTATAPTSYAIVADNVDSRLYSWFDNTPVGISHSMSCTQVGWSQVVTPTTTPYAGAPGCIQFYSNNGTASGAGVAFTMLIKGVYDFRIRV